MSFLSSSLLTALLWKKPVHGGSIAAFCLLAGFPNRRAIVLLLLSIPYYADDFKSDDMNFLTC
jgi:hypothetical protein